MQDDKEVPLHDLKALLAELAGAGGQVALDPTAQYNRRVRGSVGSTNVLDEQQSRSLRNHRVSLGGSAAAGANKLSSPPPTPPSRSAAFSTYAPEPVDGAGRSQHTVPLHIRLPPVDGGPTAPVATQRQRTSIGSLSLLTGDGAEASIGKITSPASVDPRLGLRTQPNRGEHVGVIGGGGATVTESANPHSMHRPRGSDVSGALGDDDGGESVGSSHGDAEDPPAQREANFLPIMCARYLRPGGLTPRGRWGHTLTPINASTLLSFGGMDTDGDTSDLFEFDTRAIAWDPVYVAKGEPPATRYGHAACGYDGRYLVIFGGACRNATKLFNDIHMYDVLTQEWRCVWSDGAAASKCIPGARLGHSMVLRDDKLYIYGGRVLNKSAAQEGGGSAVAFTTLANADVYVFSLNSKQWRKRIRCGRAAKAQRKSSAAANADVDTPQKSDNTRDAASAPVNPVYRAYHAACVKGDYMYVNGGSGAVSSVLSDTWRLCLSTGEWSCLHTGAGADAIPREKHNMFVCGEALLLVGGCSASSFHIRVTEKFTNFVCALPLMGQPTPCWIPVAMGNVSIVAPSRKSFAAAFHGGFVYVFGGMSGPEPATNTMVRFLAADGYASADSTASKTAGDTSLRVVAQRMRDKPALPCDVYVVAEPAGSEMAATSRAIGLHKALLQRRAPLLWEALKACRSAAWTGGSGKHAPPRNPRGSLGSQASTEILQDAMQRLSGPVGDAGVAGPTGPPHTPAMVPHLPSSSSGSGPVLYYTRGNSRVQGLSVAHSDAELACLVDYLYFGGLRAEFRLLLEEEDHDGDAEDSHEGSSGGTTGATAAADGQRSQLRSTLQSLQQMALTYQLKPLSRLCEALLTGNAHQVARARRASAKHLRKDFLGMLKTGAGATVTVLFVDPHTQEPSAHVLHPLVLMSASSFFADLLRPLYTGERTSFEIGQVASKVMVSGGLLGSTSKRAVVVGPIAVPTPAVQPILRFLYTQQVIVPPERAFQTMIGAHMLELSQLQACAEAIVARDVTYESSCTFYYHARKYRAALLEEMTLLTAVSGYAEVRHHPSYLALSDADRQSIDTVAEELSSASWVPPPQPTQEMKPAAAYTARWKQV